MFKRFSNSWELVKASARVLKTGRHMTQPMNENTQPKESLNVKEGKDIAYYSALVQAWIQTRMERDKTLCTLSAAGIGVLVTLLTAIGVRSRLELIPYAGAFVGFSITIVTTILIFQRNSKYIEDILNKSTEKDYHLSNYDRCSLIGFIFAIICAIAIGSIAAWHQVATTQITANGG